MQSKLKGRNSIQAINTWVENQLEETGVTELRPKNMETAKSDWRLTPTVFCSKIINYVPRVEGGRELIPMEGYINQTRISLERCVQSSEEKLLKTVAKDEAKSQEMFLNKQKGWKYPGMKG